MQSAKYQKIKAMCEVGKYERSFDTCVKMIPRRIQDKLNAEELAQMVDVINRSYENGHSACYREMKD